MLKSIKEDRFLSSNASNKARNKFLKIVSDLFDIAFPKNNIEVKNKHLNTPWIAKGFRKSSEHLYEKFLKKETIKNERTYKT